MASDRFGLLSSHPACALQNRAAFLLGRPSYLLYFWEIADQHQLLLQSALQRLDDDVGATDASLAPSATSSGGGHQQGQETPNEEPPQESFNKDV